MCLLGRESFPTSRVLSLAMGHAGLRDHLERSKDSTVQRLDPRAASYPVSLENKRGNYAFLRINTRANAKHTAHRVIPLKRCYYVVHF